MKFNLISSLTLMLIISSCGKNNESGTTWKPEEPVVTQEKEIVPENITPKEPEPVPVEPTKLEASHITLKVDRKVDLRTDLTNQTEYIEKLNQRVILGEISLSENIEAALRCKKEGETASQSVPFLFAKSKVQAIIDLVLKEDVKPQKYHCEVVDPEGNLIMEQTFELKSDFYVKGTKELPKNLNLFKFDAFVIDDKGVLITNGSSILLNADTFLSVGTASISTFKEKDLASAPNRAGQSGGAIQIEAKKAYGTLSVFLKGTNAGVTSTIDESYAKFKAPTRCEHGNYEHSYKFPRKGKPGLPGGDSGSFIFKAALNDLSIKIMKIPGLGGEGQITTNPVSEIVVSYKKVDKLRTFPYNVELGKFLASQSIRPEVKVSGTICFVKLLQWHHKVGDYNLTTMTYKKIPSLPLKVAEKIQKGERGQNGKELTACVIDASRNTKDCY